MDFDFTDDQEQLRDAVRKWVDKGYGFERRRGIAKAGGFSREAYGQIAELGLTGLYIPEADGGLGMTLHQLPPLRALQQLEPVHAVADDDHLAILGGGEQRLLGHVGGLDIG